MPCRGHRRRWRIGSGCILIEAAVLPPRLRLCLDGSGGASLPHKRIDSPSVGERFPRHGVALFDLPLAGSVAPSYGSWLDLTPIDGGWACTVGFVPETVSCCLLVTRGQEECELCSPVHTRIGHSERASQLTRRQCAARQPETVTGPFRGKTVDKNADDVFCGDAHATVSVLAAHLRVSMILAAQSTRPRHPSARGGDCSSLHRQLNWVA